MDAALSRKVLKPFLGQPYGDALSIGELKLQFDASNGKIFPGYCSHRFPLSIATHAHVLRTAGSPHLEPVITAFELIRHDDVEAVIHADHGLNTTWKDAFTGRRIETGSSRRRLTDALYVLPVALFAVA
jgi:maltooligosyltrehalose synthase